MSNEEKVDQGKCVANSKGFWSSPVLRNAIAAGLTSFLAVIIADLNQAK